MTERMTGTAVPGISVALAGVAALASAAGAVAGPGAVTAVIAALAATLSALFGIRAVAALRSAGQAEADLAGEGDRLRRGESDILEAGPAILRDAVNARLAGERRKLERMATELRTAQDEAAALARLAAARDSAFAQALVARDGRVLHASAAFADLVGRPGETITQASFDELVGAAGGAALLAEADGGSAAKAVIDVGGRTLDIAAAPVRDAEGVVESVSIIATDISDHAAASAEAQAAAARFAAAPVPLAEIAQDGRVIARNAAFDALEGANPEARLVDGGRFRLPAASGLVLDDLVDAAQRAPKTVEVTLGETSLRVTVAAAHASETDAARFFVTAEPVDGAFSPRAFAATLEHAGPAAVFSPEGTVEAANAAFAEAIGTTPEALAGRSFTALVGAPGAGDDAATAWSGVIGGERRSGTFALARAGGEPAWLRAELAPVRGEDGALAHVVMTAAEVSGHVRAEVEARAQTEAIARGHLIASFSLDGRVVSASEAFAEALGHAPGELDGFGHDGLFRIVGGAEDIGALFDRLRTGESVSVRIAAATREGGERIFESVYCPVTDRSGAVVRAVAVARDVTGAEAAAASIADRASGFEAAPEAIVIAGPDGIVRAANAAAFRFFGEVAESLDLAVRGVDPAAIIGADLRAFHTDLPTVLAACDDSVAGAAARDITAGARILAVAAARTDARGGGFVVRWADVTAERNATYMMRALDQSQALIEFDIDGTIRTANANFQAAMGYALEEIRGQHHRMFVDFGETSEEEYASFWSDLASGAAITGRKIRRLRKSGEPIYLQASYTPITDDDGQVYKIIKTAQDITEVELSARAERAERERRSSEQDTVVEQLAGGLKRLADGDFTVELTEHFPEDYMQLRYDFNDAVAKLRAAEAVRTQAAADQSDVVRRLASGLERLAEGVLTFQLDGRFPPEYDQLRCDFNQAIARLRDVMGAITDTAATLKSGASDISQAADDLSKRTENQAATLEETAAALDQITATVRQTAEGATEANRVASETRDEAQASGKVVGDAVSAMGEIERSSTQISQIIGVIDDIAFQTNLLALNAGVEAARAGDAGRGFAVVAQEVRALAQRSSEAAKEIKELISTSSEQVSRGVELVGRAGSALGDIVGRVENVSDLVSEIAASAQEQSVSLAEVNAAMNKMDQVTQQNAAMVEESTAASHSLASASAQLIEHVAHFDTGGEAPAPAAPRPAEQGAEPAPQEPPVRYQREAAQAFFAGVGASAEKLEVEDDNWEEF